MLGVNFPLAYCGNLGMSPCFSGRRWPLSRGCSEGHMWELCLGWKESVCWNSHLLLTFRYQERPCFQDRLWSTAQRGRSPSPSDMCNPNSPFSYLTKETSKASLRGCPIWSLASGYACEWNLCLIVRLWYMVEFLMYSVSYQRDLWDRLLMLSHSQKTMRSDCNTGVTWFSRKSGEARPSPNLMKEIEAFFFFLFSESSRQWPGFKWVVEDSWPGSLFPGL